MLASTPDNYRNLGPSVSNPISVLKTKGDRHSFKHAPWGGEKNEKWLCGRFRGRETQPPRAITLFECGRRHGPSASFSRKTSRSFFSITRHPLQSSTAIQSTSSSPHKAETCRLVAKILTSELKDIHTRNCYRVCNRIPRWGTTCRNTNGVRQTDDTTYCRKRKGTVVFQAAYPRGKREPVPKLEQAQLSRNTARIPQIQLYQLPRCFQHTKPLEPYDAFG